MPTREATTYFSVRHFPVTLLDELRTFAALRTGDEGKRVSLMQAHTEVVRLGLEAGRERRRRKAKA